MSSVSTEAGARADKLDAMHGNWLSNAGAQLHQAARFAVVGRQIGAEQDDIGITAAAPLAAGETVVAVPSKVLLNPSVVAASAAGARIIAAAGAAQLPKPSSGAIFAMRYCIGLPVVDHADEYHWYNVHVCTYNIQLSYTCIRIRRCAYACVYTRVVHRAQTRSEPDASIR